MRPEQAAFSGRRQAHQKIFTFHVHQLIHPIRRVLGTMSPVFQFVCACRNVESVSPKCKQGGKHFLGTKSMLAQPMVFLARWKHNFRHTADHVLKP